MSEKIKINEPETTSNWDILKHNHSEEAAMHAKTLSEIQHQFTHRIDNLRENKEKMSEKEFLKWEDEYLDESKKMQKEVNDGNMSLIDSAGCMHQLVAFPGAGQEENLEKTIEAQAGNYFYERSKELRKAIDSSDLDKQAQNKEKSLIEDFVRNTYEHIYFKYMDRDSVNNYGHERYERNRTDVHNKTIKSLNAVNNLAKKYNLRPFTPRNFWPSDIVAKSRQTPELAKILRYDRDIVEEYYEIAFPEATEKAKQEFERNSRFLR